MYRDCPHRSDKVRVVHNVQQEETMEDMGKLYLGSMHPWTTNKHSFNHT
jgi:hypothetical protein